jgi:hypothetical protein
LPCLQIAVDEDERDESQSAIILVKREAICQARNGAEAAGFARTHVLS